MRPIILSNLSAPGSRTNICSWIGSSATFGVTSLFLTSRKFGAILTGGTIARIRSVTYILVPSIIDMTRLSGPVECKYVPSLATLVCTVRRQSVTVSFRRAGNKAHTSSTDSRIVACWPWRVF